jgi:hypothetical protein
MLRNNPYGLLAAELLLIAAAAAMAPRRAAAATPEESAGKLVTPTAQHAIDRGLAFLARRQRGDGSFGSGGYSRNVAVCALAGMAFMSGGSTPDRGPYGAQVSRCVDFLLDSAQESGLIDTPEASGHGPLYGHGFATLFLAEVYGMSQRSEVRDKLSKAVELIVNTQNDQGGWRYQPIRREADISVTVCEVMALRAARNAGLFVPKETIDRAIEYVKQCQNADGGFRYMLELSGGSEFPRSAAGIVALHSAGIYDGPEIELGLAYLMDHIPGGDSFPGEKRYYYYGHYYAVQAMWHAGGDYWTRWYPAIRDELCARQRPDDGAWSDSICQEYGTAMACLVLQMPNNYLPIFQR